MPRSRHAFDLNSLMLVVALAAAWLAVLRTSRGLGVAFAVVALPSLVVASRMIAQSQGEGPPLPVFDKVVRFFVAVALVLLVVLPSCVSLFFAVGVGTLVCERSGYHPGYAMTASLIVAGGVGYGCYRLIRRALDDPQSPS